MDADLLERWLLVFEYTTLHEMHGRDAFGEPLDPKRFLRRATSHRLSAGLPRPREMLHRNDVAIVDARQPLIAGRTKPGQAQDFSGADM